MPQPTQVAFACITVVLAVSIIYIISRLRKLDEHVQHLYKAQQMSISREEFEESMRPPAVLMCPLPDQVSAQTFMKSSSKVEEIFSETSESEQPVELEEVTDNVRETDQDDFVQVEE